MSAGENGNIVPVVETLEAAGVVEAVEDVVVAAVVVAAVVKAQLDNDGSVVRTAQTRFPHRSDDHR
jgi:hypothetical protein